MSITTKQKGKQKKKVSLEPLLTSKKVHKSDCVLTLNTLKPKMMFQTLQNSCFCSERKPGCAHLPLSPLHMIVQLSLLVALAGLKGHLEYLVSKPVAVQAGDGHGRLLVVRHGNEAEALALVGVEISDHLDVSDSTEGAEHLPQDALIGILAQVVDEDAPAGRGVPGNAHASHATHVINPHWGEPKPLCLVV